MSQKVKLLSLDVIKFEENVTALKSKKERK